MPGRKRAIGPSFFVKVCIILSNQQQTGAMLSFSTPPYIFLQTPSNRVVFVDKEPGILYNDKAVKNHLHILQI